MRHPLSRYDSLGALLAIAMSVPPAVAGQASGFAPGGQDLFSLNIAGTPVGEIPTNAKLLKGTMEVVLKDGVPMLKASSASEFLITLPQVLPQNFTLEFELVPKACCNPQDLSFEGTPAINQAAGSAHVLWDSDGYLAVIGGGAMYESPMPEELRTTLPGVLTTVVAVFQGNTIRLYTNGRRLYTLSDRPFARGRVLRVFLGGQDDGANAVHLARLRIATGAPLTGIAAATQQPGVGQQVGGAGAPPTSAQSQAPSGGTGRVITAVAVTQGTTGPVVTWASLGGATSYTVRRWKIGDATCCNNTSPSLKVPPWQDGALPVAGTYVYEVTASTPAGIATGQAQFIQFKSAGQIATLAPPATMPAASTPSPSTVSGVPTTPATRAGTAVTNPNTRFFVPPPPRTIVLPGITAESGVSPVAPRTLVLAGLTAAGGFDLVAPRTLTLAGFTATGPGIRVSRTVVGTSGSSIPAPKTIMLGGLIAAGQLTVVSSRRITLTAVTARGSFTVVAPRTIGLAGWTAVGPASIP